jgi:ubiquinone/menaquinone biosynthesis C-methylase UbiE
MQRQFELYTTLAEVYDEIYQQIFDYDWEAKIVEKALENHKNAKILDAGIGSGRLAAILSQKGFPVTGVDISDEMLKIARKNAPEARILKADIKSLPFKSEFDAAVCLGRTTTYMLTDTDVKKLLESLYRALKEGGVLVIDAFDKDKLAEQFDRYSDRVEEYKTQFGVVRRRNQMRWLDSEHVEWSATYQVDGKTYTDVQELRVFSRTDFKQLLEGAGFKVLKVVDAPPSIAPAFLVVAKNAK